MVIRKKIGVFFRWLYPDKVFIILGVVFIFFIALRPPTDPDMGWHLADGKYLAEHHFQVAKTDPFSFTMPDFPVVMHEWMADLAAYSIYRRIGLFALSLAAAAITTAAFLVVSAGMEAEREHKVVAGMLGIIASIPILGVRAQMISLLGLALVVYTIYAFKNDPRTKKIFLLPLIFFFWANLHGGFPIGLFLLVLFIFFESIKLFLVRRTERGNAGRFFRWLGGYLEKSQVTGQALLQLSSVTLVSFLLTFVNPYGWRIYVEVFTTVFDTYAKGIITEWLPVSILNPVSSEFLVYLVLLVFLLFFGFRRIGHLYLAIAIIFLYLAFSSWRHLPIFLLISIPLWVEIVGRLSGKELIALTRSGWFLVILTVIVCVVAYRQSTDVFAVSTSLDRLAQEGAYPLGAVRYLQEHPIEGRMFNEYNWGGFLIWQYPQKKVFVDGRMPSWKQGDFRAFEEFNRVTHFEGEWQEILDREQIHFILTYNNPLSDAVFASIGWRQVYADDLAVIFVRPD